MVPKYEARISIRCLAIPFSNLLLTFFIRNVITLVISWRIPKTVRLKDGTFKDSIYLSDDHSQIMI